MDFSIFERVFALRDEARKAQLGAEVPDLSNLNRGKDGGEVVQPANLPDEKLASDLMVRAVALREQANKSMGKNDHPSRAVIAELLRAASAPLPAFDESALDMWRPAPTARDIKQPLAIDLAAPVEERRLPSEKKRVQKKTGYDGTTKRTVKKTARKTRKK